MSNDPKLIESTSLPVNFKIAEVRVPHAAAVPGPVPVPPPPPSLGPLAAFVGNWHGNGFNTIFRPNNPITPTKLPIDVGAPDNILELNRTQETLSFSASLGSVPNRGMVQADTFLNGVPYLQSINDITDPAHPTGIHLEPGLWVIVPSTTNPAEGVTLVRMASIPHGTTILAQGTSRTIAGPPTIPPVDITPTFNGGGPIRFPSQTASASGTPRIPQDLTLFITAGTITQAMLDDPNSVLRNHIASQHIVSTTEISITTKPQTPLFGEGAANIAFLLGNAAATQPNAQTTLMKATFWIETVEHKLVIPPVLIGQPPIHLTPGVIGHPSPTLVVTPPHGFTGPHTITFRTTQIQYSQSVMLNFNGLTWPHVSVATLVPAGPVQVPWA
jgi:hypothetical protein